MSVEPPPLRVHLMTDLQLERMTGELALRVNRLVVDLEDCLAERERRGHVPVFALSDEGAAYVADYVLDEAAG